MMTSQGFAMVGMEKKKMKMFRWLSFFILAGGEDGRSGSVLEVGGAP